MTEQPGGLCAAPWAGREGPKTKDRIGCGRVADQSHAGESGVVQRMDEIWSMRGQKKRRKVIRNLRLIEYY